MTSVIKPISADSHVTEPPGCYVDRVSSKFKDRAPKIVRRDNGFDAYCIEGLPTFGVAGIASAGKDPAKITYEGKFEDLYRGGWDGKARLADQDRDGVAAEIVYPTVGMVLCAHIEYEYKRECMRAYNDWLQEFCADTGGRCFGIGQIAIRDVNEAIKDLEGLHARGFKGVMLPGNCDNEADYHDPMYDPLWQAAVALDMPVSFHIATMKVQKNNPEHALLSMLNADVRGPGINTPMHAIRALQDIIGMFIFGRVFERNGGLKLVSVEADAGWIPHYLQKIDHLYQRHRHWRGYPSMEKKPSEYFRENVYSTFQDDQVAFESTGRLNPRHLMWANDFPHSDATWPWSQELLARETANLGAQEKSWILRDNVNELYKLGLN
jgi:predicted TIM-barrel fold metal-dependent hydrolase